MDEHNMAQYQNDRGRYRSSFAATVLFSGVQIYQIIIRIIKSKFVALFIGPVGMGIQSLLHSTADTISAATNLGLNTSSVKTIAAANREGDYDLIMRNVTAQRRLIWITGFAGLLICSLLAPLWSRVSFGNLDYIWSFVIISVTILLDQLNKGELALLQGMQQKKKLARANVIGQTLNAALTIPLYYFYGVEAIVISIVLGSLISVIISTIYFHQLKIPTIRMSLRETFSIGREMIKLGFFLSLQYLMSTLVIWIIRNYVSNVGGVDEVGLYSAGTTIVSTYLGLVFAAIATDYYPRLAATRSKEELSMSLHTQAELTILLLAPMAVAFMVFCKPVIILLYSDKFLPVENMMNWSISAVLLQAMGWAISFTLLAKAKPAYFFLNELASTLWGLPIKLFCYKFWGLSGFGMATMIVYALYLFQVYVVTKKIFGLRYDSSLWKLFALSHLPIMVTVILKLLLANQYVYFIGGFVFLISGLYSLYKLNQKMDLKSFVAGVLDKKKEKKNAE